MTRGRNSGTRARGPLLTPARGLQPGALLLFVAFGLRGAGENLRELELHPSAKLPTPAVAVASRMDGISLTSADPTLDGIGLRSPRFSCGPARLVIPDTSCAFSHCYALAFRRDRLRRWSLVSLSTRSAISRKRALIQPHRPPLASAEQRTDMQKGGGKIRRQGTF